MDIYKAVDLFNRPDTESRNLYLLTIGNKNTQRADIQYCKDFVSQIGKR